MTGQVNGLCNAYCEAMDCDAAEPQASDQACARVLSKIEDALGGTPFPTCEDVDDDGVPNGIDNCPDVANADQADADANGTGDACDAPADTDDCPCLGADGAPATAALARATAHEWGAAHPAPYVGQFCNICNYYTSTPTTDDSSSVLASPGGTFNKPSRVIAIKEADTYTVNVGRTALTSDEVRACIALVEVLRDEDPLGICTH